MRVRLRRKLADVMDGIDLSDHIVGDILDLPALEAELLIAEGWAAAVRGKRQPSRDGDRDRGLAADAPRPRRRRR
jgi:hypothetical protein